MAPTIWSPFNEYPWRTSFTTQISFKGFTPVSMIFRTMLQTDISGATSLFIERHQERRSKNPLYPPTLISNDAVRPLISEWLSNGHGVVAEQDGAIVGYLVGRKTTGMGGIEMSFTPEWAHATKIGSFENMTGDLYTKWCRVSDKPESTLHMAIVFADDVSAHDCFVQKGFGRHLIDGGRVLDKFEPGKSEVDISKATATDLDQINALDAKLTAHLDQAPIYRPSSPASFGRFSGGHIYDLSWITEPTKSIWVSRSGDALTGFMSAEYGPQRPSSLRYPLLPQIEGAFLDPSFRGSGSANGLLDALLGWVSESGCRYCTVDFETSNPEGSSFWLRNDFEPLLFTMTRRLDARYGS